MLSRALLHTRYRSQKVRAYLLHESESFHKSTRPDLPSHGLPDQLKQGLARRNEVLHLLQEGRSSDQHK